MITLNAEPKAESLPIWDQDIEPHVQKSIDRVLDYMIAHGLSPFMEISGDILETALIIAKEFPASLPEHLQEDGKNIVTYLLQWLADYADETNASHMNLTLKLTKGH
jgi:hypothetical protein